MLTATDVIEDVTGVTVLPPSTVRLEDGREFGECRIVAWLRGGHSRDVRLWGERASLLRPDVIAEGDPAVPEGADDYRQAVRALRAVREAHRRGQGLEFSGALGLVDKALARAEEPAR